MAKPHANPPSHYHSNIFLLLLQVLELLLLLMSSDSSLYKTKRRELGLTVLVVVRTCQTGTINGAFSENGSWGMGEPRAEA